MTKYYQGIDTILVAIDSIILGFKDNDIHVLLIKRKFDPMHGEDSLMGGFVGANEDLNAAISRVLKEYTGLDDVYMEQVGTYGDVGRDAGGRVICVAYYALIDMQLFDESLEKTHNAKWVKVSEVGDLIFDHNQFISDAMKRLRIRAATQPIGFNLLPEKFTLPQIQTLYEAIYQKPLDKRNFRKKLLDMDILEKLDEKDKSSSKKGAYYYRFNKEKYDKLLADGFYFSL